MIDERHEWRTRCATDVAMNWNRRHAYRCPRCLFFQTSPSAPCGCHPFGASPIAKPFYDVGDLDADELKAIRPLD